MSSSDEGINKYTLQYRKDNKTNTGSIRTKKRLELIKLSSITYINLTNLTK